VHQRPAAIRDLGEPDDSPDAATLAEAGAVLKTDSMSRARSKKNLLLKHLGVA
jgi:hypothetical protein